MKSADDVALRAFFMGIARSSEGQLYIENLPLDQYILECTEDVSQASAKFKYLYICIDML